MHKILIHAARAALAILVTASIAGPVTSQSLRKVTAPAEYPPSAFKGKQYVDSRGCVFIRAGFGGRVTWVPRVNRKRKVYCSKQNKPSLTGSQLATLQRKVNPASTDTVLDLSQPTIKRVAAPKRKTVTAPPKKVVKKVVKSIRTKPARVLVLREPAVQQVVQPKRIVTRKKVVTQRIATRRVGQKIHPGDLVRNSRGANEGTDNTRNVTVFSNPTQAQTGVRTNTTRVVRRRQATGQTQQIHPGDLVRSRRLQAAASANASIKTSSRTTRRTVRVVTADQVVDPIHGLTTTGPVIEADVTREGDAQMELVWTNTVPRKLIQRKTRVRKVVSKRQYRTTQSTKKVVVKQRATQATSKRYVQIGTFGDASNAQRTIRRFQAGGVPVATRNVARGGRNLKVVLLGPFGSSAQMQSALRSARGAGFGDAFYVN